MVDRPRQLFDPGQCGVTPGAAAALEALGLDVLALIHRHASGDWGIHGTFDATVVTDAERRGGAFATADDAKLNRLAVEQNDGSRVMSEYRLGDQGDVRLWIVTEGEPGARNTVVMTPEEY
jgi:hypothetical protein